MKKFVFNDQDQGGIIQVANIKGGVGKSTIATNLAANLAAKAPTLLIDLDPQGCASVAYGKDPASFSHSSYHLFRHRYYPPSVFLPKASRHPFLKAVKNAYRRLFFRKGEHLKKLTVKIMPGLDLIPANASLYKKINGRQVSNFLFSLKTCREYYKYIIIDTASVWDEAVRGLFSASDLNLIPVTLNALSTKSLKEYLVEVSRVVRDRKNINVRIVKNEVYGGNSSKNSGKVRTMKENREFLHSLMETFGHVPGQSGFSLVRSIILNLEIPETSVIRDAQDSGLSLVQFNPSGQVKKAFANLTDSVQFILNRIQGEKLRQPPALWARAQPGIQRFAKAAVFLLVFLYSKGLYREKVPQVLTPPQLETTDIPLIVHEFENQESLYQMAKFAISEYRALLPAPEALNQYILETVRIHNLTAGESGEPYIENLENLPAGTTVTFYPPSFLFNKNFKIDREIFDYYKTLVKDDHPYITGLWGERGLGGGDPHTGVDIACPIGSEIISPSRGRVEIQNTFRGGNMVTLKNDDYILLFAHLDRRFVKTGDVVEKGQVLGTSGMTGVTSGPHLHFGYGIRSSRDPSDYTFIDPNNWVFRQDFYRNKKAAVH